MEHKALWLVNSQKFFRGFYVTFYEEMELAHPRWLMFNYNAIAPPIIWSVYQDDMVVPDDQLLLIPASLLPPQGHDPLLVADEDHGALGQFTVRVRVGHALANFVDILFAVAGCITALKIW